MADSRRGARGHGKSDSIDAIAVARRVARRPGALPAAQLQGPELDLRLVVDYPNVRQRVALNNTLHWHLHDLWPELQLPGSSLFHGNWGPRVAGRLARTEQTMRVRIARDELRRIRELTQTIKALEAEIAGLVAQIAPQLLYEPGFGPLTAAKLVGEIADSAETAVLAERGACAASWPSCGPSSSLSPGGARTRPSPVRPTPRVSADVAGTATGAPAPRPAAVPRRAPRRCQLADLALRVARARAGRHAPRDRPGPGRA